MATEFKCPACASASMSKFFEIPGVPVHCNVLLRSRGAAIGYPRGEMALGFCANCGHIYNMGFDPELLNYCPEYENSLAFSPLFRTYLEDLAQHLVDKHQLFEKEVIEIGCGKADFLTLLCERGNNRGIGFDPSYEFARSNGQTNDRIRIIQDFYSERYASCGGDLVCSRHTLEHVEQPLEMLATVRRSIGSHRSPITFFEVPNGLCTLREMAIWDIIYEHCSYFTAGSLTRVFRSSGFNVSNVAEAFGGQFLWIEARPGPLDAAPSEDDRSDVAEVARAVDQFAGNFQAKMATWRGELAQLARQHERTVVWGAGSKGVTFLNMLGVQDQIEYVVDINPHKKGMFISGTGQEIVAPEFLKEYRPEVVLVMNPIYQDEIRNQITSAGLEAKLLCV